MPNADFIIAGGGIGGAALAALLARGGKRVLVLERNTAAPTLARPEGLWPVTASRLHKLLEHIGDNKPLGEVLQGMRVMRGDEMLFEITPEHFKDARAKLLMTDPNATRERLLHNPAFELRRGVEVVSVLKDGARVVGVRARSVSDGSEAEFTAPWTVGDDGAHSRVREAAGIALKTRMFPVDFVVFGFDWPDSLPANVGRMFINQRPAEAGLIGMGAIPMPGARGAGLLPAKPTLLDDPAKCAKVWKKFCELNPGAAELAAGRKFFADFTRIRRPFGHASSYSAPGVLILGDAAHPVSPVGGQGASMSVADAFVLAQEALRGGKNFPARYESRRRSANERSLNFTRRGAQAFGLPAFLFDLVSPIGFRLLRKDPSLISNAIKAAAAAFQD